MRKSIFTIGLIFFALFSCSTQNEKKFKLKANWEKGEVKEMIVLQSGSRTMEGEEDIFPVDTIGQYNIEIVDRSSKGYIIEWKIINNNKELDGVAFMKEYISEFKYIIETDLDGNFIELTNWKSLLELNMKLKENIIKEAKNEDINQVELDNLVSQMKLAETKDEIIKMCNELTDIFHGSYGEELLINDTILEPTTIPNQHFKEGIPVTLETITKELDNDKISIRYAYVYNYEELKKLQEKQFPDQEYTEQKMNSYSEFIYDTKTGWIEKITFYNYYEYEGSKNTSIIENIIK